VLKGFRDFIMRGNVIELAVAVVIGTAFNNVVTQFTKSFIEPLIRLLGGGTHASAMWFIKGHRGDPNAIALDYGGFINALLSFLITAAVVYFIFVVPMTKAQQLRARGLAPEPEAIPEDTLLLRQIRDALGARPMDGTAGPTPQQPDL
jgi:large conductance mechanosensitive channel